MIVVKKDLYPCNDHDCPYFGLHTHHLIKDEAYVGCTYWQDVADALAGLLNDNEVVLPFKLKFKKEDMGGKVCTYVSDAGQSKIIAVLSEESVADDLVSNYNRQNEPRTEQ